MGEKPSKLNAIPQILDCRFDLVTPCNSFHWSFVWSQVLISTWNIVSPKKLQLLILLLFPFSSSLSSIAIFDIEILIKSSTEQKNDFPPLFYPRILFELCGSMLVLLLFTFWPYLKCVVSFLCVAFGKKTEKTNKQMMWKIRVLLGKTKHIHFEFFPMVFWMAPCTSLPFTQEQTNWLCQVLEPCLMRKMDQGFNKSTSNTSREKNLQNPSAIVSISYKQPPLPLQSKRVVVKTKQENLILTRDN